ncbi:MAG: UDP-N-acetylmuramoyl-L-alanine--D-glutamate ligase [Halieaceae bacterium]|jgi:UDP-N-acetylmuramoylalanine--D-glutamate ligase|nr:UDP-N-acetylmuramoyl-L-alanine--D-glutamate ligase [Halieaceae bacterium]
MADRLIASSESPLVVGLGSTGLSCVRYFTARGIPCAVADSRAKPPGLDELQSIDAELSVQALDAEVLMRAGRLVVSPGVALDEPAVAAAIEAGVPVCGDIDLFCEEAAAPVVGITGSNGKSTVTALLGEMAAAAGRRVAVGGNLGTPALDLLDDAVELYVLELSSFQLERAGKLGLALATVLNMSPDHMDRHHNMQAYHAAKHRIFLNCGAAVFNREDPLSRPLQADTVPAWSFGLDAPDRRGYGLREHEGSLYIFREFQPLMPAGEIKLVGRHNLANALAALAMGELLGLPADAMREALANFAGLPHRSQLVGEANELRFVNDSKATNPGATLAALGGFDKGVVLILGGQGKGADFTELAAATTGCRRVILMGEDAGLLDAALPPGVSRERVASMDAAVDAAVAAAEPGDVILLSPACASFDMFAGFAARGDAFCQSVARYLDGGVA